METIIKWFEEISDLLNEKFPTRRAEELSQGRRGSEIAAVNTAIVKCKNAVEYLNNIKILESDIKDGFKKFDDMYESLEVKPYNAAYDYYKAGYEQCMKDI